MKLPGSLVEAGCRKPGCRSDGALNRHHKRHEAMWFGIWASYRKGDGRFEHLKERYAEFRDEDVVWLCRRHHAEIHSLYDIAIKDECRRNTKRLYQFSWEEAIALMDRLEGICRVWLQVQTPGLSPSLLNKRRAKRYRKDD